MTRCIPTPPHLLERAAHGDPEALSDLVRARKDHVYRLAESLMCHSLWPEAAHERERDTPRPDVTITRQQMSRKWQLILALHRALMGLRPDYLEVLVVVDLEGVSKEPAAWLLGLSEAEMTDRLRRARACLRERLSAGGSDGARSQSA